MKSEFFSLPDIVNVLISKLNYFSISFLNLNAKTFPAIRVEFSKFGEIVRMTSGGGGNTDELVSISYADKQAAVRALKTHFTDKDYPYLDIAKGKRNVFEMLEARLNFPRIGTSKYIHTCIHTYLNYQLFAES